MQSAKFHYDNVYWQQAYSLGPISLYQIGDLYCNGGYEISEHRQRCYEISYIVSGKGVFITDGRETEVSENQLYLNRPGQVHRIVSGHIEPLRYLYMGFDFSEAQEGDEGYAEIRRLFDSLTHFVATDTNNLYRIFCDAIGEVLSKRTMLTGMLKAYVSQIIIGAYRDFLYDKKTKYHPVAQVDSEQQIVYAVLNYIESNSCTVNQLSELSACLGYSYSYLSQLFSKRMGCSIKSYFRKKLFEQAIDMLREEKTISEIASELGYSTVYSFSRAFANCYGEPPGSYRRRLKGNAEEASFTETDKAKQSNSR